MKEIKNVSQGFTLIELLVVVLIIGILAAIALPQYKKAVLKSRFATVKQNTRALFLANQRYYMVNGTYCTNIKDLDVEIVNTDKMKYIPHDSAMEGVYLLNSGDIHYWVSGRDTLCIFNSDDTSVFNMLDEFCKQETNSGKRRCNNATTCYYYYNKKN